MTIAHTSVHASLGEDGDLDYQMIVRAVESRVAEDEQLDWKRENYEDGDEFAKDVAALANTRGGVLIIGVAEDRASGQATKVMPVNVSDKVQRRLHSWLGTRLGPQIPGVEVVPLREFEDDAEGILVVRVEESPDAPHFVGSENRLGAPYRIGTTTHWSREWDLEAAYQRRFARRASDEARLAEMVEHVGDQVALSHGGWLVGAMRPVVARPSVARPLSSDTAKEVMRRGLEVGLKIAAKGDSRAGVIRALGDNALNPRVGLRRWVAANRRDQTPESQSDVVHLELHDDGAAVLATCADSWHRDPLDGKHPVPDYVVMGFAADFVALCAALAEEAGMSGQMLTRVQLLRDDLGAFAFVGPETYGGGYVGSNLVQPAWTRDVRRFIPVDMVMPRTDSVEHLQNAASSIAGDIVSQFGYEPRRLRWSLGR